MSIVVPLSTNCVYRYYDKAGRLIYVGITARGPKRQHQHIKTSEWWPYADRQEIDHCADEPESRRRERDLILEFRPPFNQVHNDRYEATRAAYLAVVAAESALAAAQSGVPLGHPCGHCDSCVDHAASTDDALPVSASCHRLHPEEEVVICDICHRADCFYWDGYARGEADGWGSGHSLGSGQAYEALSPDFLPSLVLNWAVDGNFRDQRSPILWWAPGRDESLAFMDKQIRENGFVAAPDPWAKALADYGQGATA